MQNEGDSLKNTERLSQAGSLCHRKNQRLWVANLMSEMASWHRLPACGSAVWTFRGQRWLSEGVDKVAERDAARARTLKIVGQASLPVVAARASWLAPHLRAVTVLAMPTSSAQLPLFIRTLRPKALALIAQRFVIGTHNGAPEAGALTKDPLWGAAAAPFSPGPGEKIKAKCRKSSERLEACPSQASSL